MAFESRVYRILIASPSDVYEEREIAARVIQEWNDLHSFNKKTVLLPLKWETHTAPTYGERPQEVINRQIVDDCDLVIGFLGTRIGSPTGKDISGTIEEIKRASDSGKPVMLYFSKRGTDPSSLDTEQLDELNKFKSSLYSAALIENYSTLVEFSDKLSRQLEIKIRELQSGKESDNSIKFSIVSIKTGKLLNENQSFSIECVDVSKSEYRNIYKKGTDSSRYKLYSLLEDIQTKNNRIPLVLGLENSSNNIYNNATLELKISCNKERILKIGRIRSTDNQSIANNLAHNHFKEDEYKELSKLYSSDIYKVDSKEWVIEVPEFNLLPQKIKYIDPLILLYPMDSCELEIKAKLFSVNLFETLEYKCKVKINHSSRKLTDEEITNCLEKSREEDVDLPF